MAKKRRKRRVKSKTRQAIKTLKNNPGLVSSSIGIVKTVAPGAGTFFASAFLSGRVEALVSGAGITAPVPTSSTTKQRVAALATSVAVLGGAYLISNNRRLKDYQVSMLVGAGVGVLLQLVRLFWRPQQRQAYMPTGQTQANTPYGVNDPATTEMVAIDRVEDFDDDLPGADGNLYSGMFEQESGF